MITVEQAATAYAARGWKPVPAKRGGKEAIGKGWQTRAFDPKQFNGNAQNVAIQFGEVSGGLTDIDLDCTEAIGLALDFLPDTQAIFGRNAKPASHMLYVTDLYKTEKKAVAKYEHQGRSLVELRVGGNGKGALSVFPPSMHHGENVAWIRDGEPAKVANLDLKRAVFKLALACVLAPAYPGQGARHEGALVLGGVLARAGFEASDIEHLMRVLTRQARDDEADDRITTAVSALGMKANGHELPGFPRLAEVWGKDAADTLAKWFKAERTMPGAIGPGGFEDSIALEFAKMHGEDYRYVAKASRWMNWTGSCWREEATYAAYDHARQLCRAAGRIGDAKARTVNGVVTLARTDRRLAAVIEQWDHDPDILCADNITVDLKTGQKQPPNRLNYCTKQTAIAPAPEGTPCDLWLRFLDRITKKDDDLIGFLQRFCGYCLTGHTYEHVLAFLYGTGANGKGTFIKTIGGILADYCITSPIEMFLLAKYDRHPTELARLRSVRLTVAQETPKGRTWDESKIKNMTGGDVMSARFMRCDFFDFDPNFKVLIAGNYKPLLRNIDEAIRRRFLLIPFKEQIPKRERDPQLADKLKAEWPAILRWMINGCLEWRRDGFGVPQAVSEATAQYFEDQDSIEQWLADCTKVDPYVFTTSRTLFKSWQAWCGERDLSAGTEKAFVELLSGKGYEQKRMEYGRGFKGIALTKGGQTQTEADLGEGGA